MGAKSSSLTLKIVTDAAGAVKGFRQTEKALGGVTSKSDKFAGIMKKSLVPAIGALAGAGALIGKGVKGLAADEKALNNLNSTLAATGNAAKLNVKGFQEYAGALQDTTGYGADVITQGAAMLATFKNVRNEVGKGNRIFDRATAAGLDLARKGFGNPEQNAILLGKALNDPIKGITALTRQGITFTDEQKNMIKVLVQSGKSLDAQKLIMKEIEGQVKGTAAAYGETMAGKLEIAQRRFEEVQKAIAQMVIPALTRLLEIGSAVIKWFQDHDIVAKALIITVGVLGTAIVAYNVGLKAYRAYTVAATIATTAFNVAMRANPIGIVVTALVALGAALVVAYKKSETFRNIVNKVWDIAKKLGGYVADILVGAFKAFKFYVDALLAPLKKAWEWLKKLWDIAKKVKDVLGALNPFGGTVPAGWKNPLAPGGSLNPRRMGPTEINVTVDAPAVQHITEEQVARAIARIMQKSDARNGLAWSL